MGICVQGSERCEEPGLCPVYLLGGWFFFRNAGGVQESNGLFYQEISIGLALCPFLPRRLIRFTGIEIPGKKFWV